MFKKILITVGITGAIIGFTYFCSVQHRKIRDNEKRIERIAFLKDSLAKVKKDSLDKIKQDSLFKIRLDSLSVVAKKFEPKFRKRKDEFYDNITWVKPISAPYSVRSNAIYCYFSIDNGIPKNLRFRFQYYDENWLFIKTLIFNVDGNTVTIRPDFLRDNSYDIWEWCDERVTSTNDIHYLIALISNAKNVKVKMIGSQYYKIINLTQTQIKAIKDTYDYFIALGGEL